MTYYLNRQDFTDGEWENTLNLRWMPSESVDYYGQLGGYYAYIVNMGSHRNDCCRLLNSKSHPIEITKVGYGVFDRVKYWFDSYEQVVAFRFYFGGVAHAFEDWLHDMLYRPSEVMQRKFYRPALACTALGGGGLPDGVSDCHECDYTLEAEKAAIIAKHLSRAEIEMADKDIPEIDHYRIAMDWLRFHWGRPYRQKKRGELWIEKPDSPGGLDYKPTFQ